MYAVSNDRLTGCAWHVRWSCRLTFATGLLLVWGVSIATSQAAATDAPFILEKTMKIPGVPVGPYADALAVDLAGGRIFTTPQAAKAVAVLDLHDGRVLKMIPVSNPHGVVFSPALKRLFVTDGAGGDLKVFSSEDYSLVKSIPLTMGADGLVYDPHSQLLYANNGGEGAKMKQALISEVDPVRMEKVADISIASVSLEGAAIDSDRQLLYVALDEEDNAIAVVDLAKRQTVATWKLPAGGHRAKPIAFDAAHARLYVACRDTSLHGTIFVLDTTSGRVVATLPIAGWADSIFIDQRRQRVYVSAGAGYIETYAIGTNDTYRRLAPVETEILAKTSLYSRENDRLYVSVPHLGDDGSAQVMVYKPAP
ncbi:MAG: YncE family protein [Pseudomonadota bacterium]